MFLYSFPFPILGQLRTFPVAQMLSQSHGTNFIRYWLQEWLLHNKKPDEVITDASEALMSACVQAFAKYANINAYISACVEAVVNGKQTPICFLRIDRSHFVRSLLRNKLLRKEEPRVRALILGAVGYLMICDSFADAEQVLHHLFTLTKNKFINRSVKTAKKFLEVVIGTHNINQYATEGEEMENDLVEHTDVKQESYDGTYRSTLMYSRIKNIYDSVRDETDGEFEVLDNLYYSDRVNNFLMELCTRLPMWSNIMCAKFGSRNMNPSSSGSESHFKNIKRLMGSKTRRVDVFFSDFMKHFSGITKMALAQQESMKMSKTVTTTRTAVKIRGKRSLSTGGISDTKNDSFASSPERSKSENNISGEAEENWKNKVKKSPPIRRSRASILTPHDINYQYHNVPLMSNRYESNLKVRGKYVVVEKTCAFDSALSVYTAACFDNDNMGNIFNDATNENIWSIFIKNISRRDKIVKGKNNQDLTKHYHQERTKILYQLYSILNYKDSFVENENTITISCKTTFAPFLKQLILLDGGKLSSMARKYTCARCKIEKNDHVPFIPVTLSAINKIKLNHFSRYINTKEYNLPQCDVCKNKMHLTKEYSDLLAFEIEPLLQKQFEKQSISNVQDEIQMNNSTYKLYAVVEYIVEAKHFIAHVKRKNGIWQSFDDLEPKVMCNKNIEKIPMNMFSLFYLKN